MPLLTLATARTSLWNTASKVSIGAATTQDKLDVTNLINLACIRLRNAINFRGAFARARLRVFDEQITLPSPLDGMRSLWLVNDDGTLGRQYDVFAQQSNYLNCWPIDNSYQDFGPWPASGPYGSQVRDLGDSFSLFRDPPGTFYVRCKSTLTEAGTSILLRGLDDLGNQVFQSNGTEGVSLAITTATTTTTQKFTEIASWVKAAATAGVIQLFSVDTTSGVEQAIVNISPNKLTSGYRRYSAKGFNFGQTVEALCNIAILPAVADNDPILPGNLGALKLALMAQQYEDKNDSVHAALYWGPNYPNENPGKMMGAIDVLEAERDRFDGDEVSTVPFAGFNRFPMLQLGYGGWG